MLGAGAAGSDPSGQRPTGTATSDHRTEPAEQSDGRPEDPVIRRCWRAIRSLTQFGFPRRCPIVQFPNVPLLTAWIAGWARDFVAAAGRPYLTSVVYLAMTVWAYEELVHGSNWLRQLLGGAFMIILTVRVAHAV
jgi:hypothetical protein